MCSTDVVVVAPAVPVIVAAPAVRVVAASAAPVLAAVGAAAVDVTIGTLSIGVIRIGEIIGDTGGPCPHMTALMDSANQPIRESPTGFVILVETHA